MSEEVIKTTDAGTQEGAQAGQANPEEQKDTSILSEASAEGDGKQGAGTQPEPEEGGKKEGDKKEPENEPAAEEIDFAKFEVPEGFKFDDALVQEVTPLLKELKVSQKQGQQLVDVLTKSLNKQIAAEKEAYAADVKRWTEEIKSDAEFGGTKFEENLSFAAKAIDKFAGKDANDLRQLLAETGIGNHPLLVRMFIRAGQSISEDKFVGGSSQTAEAKSEESAAKMLHPNSL